MELLLAIVAGYEVMLRVGAAVTPCHYQIWHTTATTGVFGSVIAAGRLLGLDSDQMSWAFGNAGTMAAGLWEFLQDGAMSKYLHTGKAAANGVLAALLARDGLTGASRVLEGQRGFFAGYARQAIDPALFSDFATRNRLAGVSHKPYPCCRHTHSSVDCALDLHHQWVTRAAPIESVRLETYPAALQVAGNTSAEDPRQAQFSLKYCVARALLSGSLTLDSFHFRQLQDPKVRDLMERIQVDADADLDRATPGEWPARLRLRLVDGTELQSEIRCPKGDPENPLSWDEVEEKFRSLALGLLPERKVRELIHLCRALEDLPSCADILKKVNENA